VPQSHYVVCRLLEMYTIFIENIVLCVLFMQCFSTCDFCFRVVVVVVVFSCVFIRFSVVRIISYGLL